MSKTKFLVSLGFSVTILALFLILSVSAPAQKSLAGRDYSAPTLVDTFLNHTFFTATTTNATSTPADNLRIDGADKVTMYLTHGGVATTSTGTGIFRVQVSPDAVNWYNFNKLVQNLATSTDPTTLSTVTVGAATTTTIVSLDLRNDAFHFLRCIVVETGTEGQQGEHSCSASVEY